VVGGGGGGGADGGGGGGGGGVAENNNFSLIANGTYTVTVGQGGSGGNGYKSGATCSGNFLGWSSTAVGCDGATGGTSTLGSISASGGGGGGGIESSGLADSNAAATARGGGGGAGAQNDKSGTGSAGVGGFTGGTVLNGAGNAAGGGASVSANGSNGSSTLAGAGAAGVAAALNSIVYGSGGAGGSYNNATAALGGANAGNGGSQNAGPTTPVANRGGGGGGGGNGSTQNNAIGSAGAAGVVIVRYANPTRTITYALNSGSGTAPTQSAVSEGATFLVASSTGLSRDGFSFGGWNDGTNDYLAGATYTVGASNITLTAIWASNSRTVTFNANDGSGTPSTATQTLTSGVSASLRTNTFARSGYEFLGWSTNANGSGTTYLDGANFSTTTSVTLFANWFLNTDIVSEWGSSTFTSTNPTWSPMVGTINVTRTNSGGGGTSWSTGSTTSPAYANGSSTAEIFVTASNMRSQFSNSTVSIFAWAYPLATNHSVIQERSNNSFVTSPTTHQTIIEMVSGVYNFTLPGCTPIAAGSNTSINAWHHVGLTYDGTTLKGYVNGVEVATGACTRTMPTTHLYYGVGGNDGNDMNPSAQVKGNYRLSSLQIFKSAVSALKAQNLYLYSTISFKSNFSGGATDTIQKVLNGTNTNLTANSFTRSTIPFIRWSNTSISNTPYLDASQVNLRGNLFLYAQWGYTITYKPGNFSTGSDQIGYKNYQSNTSVANSGTAATYFSRSGYTISAWSINADGSTTDYALGGTYSTDANLTLYPVWLGATYTVTYSYNSADGGNTDLTGTYVNGGTALTLPVPTRSGFSFGGWYEASNLSGTALGLTYSPTQSRTIYAKWNALSTDSTLSALTISSGTLSPSFASATITYTVSVTNASSSITVTPTRNQANATIQVKVGSGSYTSVTSGSASGSLSLNEGSNTVTILVTAQNGTTTSTYTVTVTRAASAVAPTIGTQPTSLARTVGQSVSFTVAATASDSGDLSYQWQKGGVNIANATSATYTFTTSATTDAGDYRVVVTNTKNSTTATTTSSVAKLAVAGTNNHRNFARTTPTNVLSPGRSFTSTGEVIPRSGSFTLEGWFRENAVLDNQNPIFAQGRVDIPGFGLMIASISGRKLQFFSDSGNLTSSTVIAQGKWYHFAVTFDSSSRNLKLFLNGNEIGSISSATPNLTDNFFLGRNNYYTSHFFHGQQDQFKVWTSALTGDEIKASMHAYGEGGITGKTLRTLYDFNQSSGDTMTDVLGSFNLTSFGDGTSNTWASSSLSVTFDEQLGSTVTDTTVDFYNTIADPGNPTRSGHTFTGWSRTSNGSVITFPYIFTPLEAITFYAIWQSNTVAPTIGTQPTSTAKTVGQSVSFTVAATVSDSGVLSYQWQKGGVDIANATSATYTFTTAATSDAGEYRVVVTNTKNSTTATTTSSAATLTMSAALSITTPTTGLSGTVGTAFTTLNISSSGGSGTNVFAVVTGTLPAGLSLSSGGAITGTPTTAGTQAITIRVTDSNSATATTSSFSISITSTKLATPNAPSVSATSGAATSITVTYTAVANASSHTAQLFNSGGTQIGSNYTGFTSGSKITGLSPSTSYSVKIIAVGDGTNYTSSDASTAGTVSTTAAYYLSLDRSTSKYGSRASKVIPETGNFTIEAWVSPNTFASNQAPVIFSQGAAGSRFYAKLGSGSKLVVFREGGSAEIVCSNSGIPTNTWTHIAVVSSSNVLSCFVNGISQTSVPSTPTTWGSTTLGTGFYLGTYSADVNNALYFFPGQIDEVKVWSEARSQQQIQDNLEVVPAISASTLVAYFPLDASTGTVGIDLRGNFDLTLTSTITWNPLIRTISYGAGSNGSGNTAAQTSSSNHAAVTLKDAASASGITRANHSLTAWNTNADGTSGTSYALSASYAGPTDLTLYPTWTANAITVTFNANDGSVTPATSTQSINSGSATALTANTFTRAGYAFAGWTAAADGSGTAYTNQQSVTITGAMTIFAKWTANSLTVTYDSKSGSSVTSGSVNTGASISAAPTAPTRAGYGFGGWSATDGGSAVTFPYAHGQTASFTLYAIWTANSLTVTYDSKSGSAVSNGSVNTGASISAAPTAPTRAGYSFGGWSATDGGSAVTFPYAHGQTASFTLYAIWAASALTVTYDSKSGSAVTSGSVNTAASISAAPTAPTRAGYGFGGWSATDGGTAVTFPYAHGQTANFTLYAIWTANSLTVTYDSKSGSAVSNGSVNTGASISAAPTAPTRSGYGFGGWSATDGGSAVAFPYAHGQTASFTLYAIWTANSLTVTYDSKSGSSVTSGSVNTGASISAAPTAPTRSGYGFGGWSATDGGSAVTFPYAHGQTANFTLYAIWSANSLTVTYDSKSGSAVSNGSVNTAASISAAPTAPTRAGYGFGGWSATDGGSAVTFPYAHGQTASFTLYAIWTANSLTVTYDSQSGSSVSSGTVATNATLTAPTAPTRAGYAFSGWSTTSSGSVISFTGGYVHGQTANFTLYAIWAANSLTVTYDSKSGSSVTSGSVNTGASISAAPTAPTRSGYGFGGWSATDGGTAVTFPYAHGQTANFTLYAIWTANSLTVTYDSKSGSAVSNGSVNTGASISAAPTAPTRSGYGFDGWSATDGGSAITFPYAHGQTTNFTLYAIWSANSLTVTYDSKSGSSVTSGSVNTGASISAAPTAPTRAGYGFGGWSATDGGTAVTFPFAHGQTANFTLYALWTANALTVTYDSKSGSSVSNGSVNTAASISAAPTAPTRAGYSFGGWSATDGGTAVTFPYAHGQTANFTLYAAWTANALTVTYDSKSGSSVSNGSVNTAASISAAPTAPTRAGYTFGGWSGTDGGTAITFPYAHGQTANFTLYAIWSANSLTVTYDSKSGSAVSNGSVNTGASISAAPTAPTRAGYTLGGWSATDGGSTVTFPYAHGQTANFTLYAIWNAGSLVVTYDSKGGSSVSNGAVNSGASIAAAPTAPTRAGYNFGGWSATDGGTAITFPYAHGQTANFALYALWTANTLTVTYDSKGGTSVTSGSTVTDGSISVAPTAPTKANYTFAGWSATDGGTAVTFAFTHGKTANFTLYALWTANAYVLTYVYNSADGGTRPVSANFTTGGTRIVLPTPTRTGYTFDGWYSNVALTSSIGAAGAEYSPTGSSLTPSAYAKWAPINYQVTYSATTSTGGSVPTDATNYNIGQNVVIKGNSGSLVRTGYSFAGWTFASDGTGDLLNSGSTYTTQSASMTFYAKWSANTYTITFNKNGGSGAPANTSTTYTTAGTAVNLSTAPGSLSGLTKTGFDLSGWSETPTGSVISTGYTTSANVTLYAIWTLKSISITFSKGIGASATINNFPSNTSLNYGSTLTLAGNVTSMVVISGAAHAFAGWTNGGSIYRGGDTFLIGESAPTFVAEWVKIFAVRYAMNGGTAAASSSEVDAECTFVDGNDLRCLDNQDITTNAAPTRAGYNFAGWTNQGGTTVPTAGTTKITTTNYLFYANWTAINYAIAYNTAGGSDAPTESVKQIGQSFNLATAPTRTGYNFVGWSDGTSVFGAGVSYIVGTSAVNLTAQWSPKVYTVIYDWNGGVGTPTPNDSYTVATTALTLPAVGNRVKDGYTFSGWNTLAAGNGTT
jgi:uncharacterized repeat protein (TIGR02543 family)